MKRMLVRYKTKPDRADENQRLIEGVFEELRARRSDGVRYLVLRLADGTFVHVVESAAASPLPGLPSFQAFQTGLKERQVEPPQFSDATIVGDYRMLADRGA